MPWRGFAIAFGLLLLILAELAPQFGEARQSSRNTEAGRILVKVEVCSS
jgi:hypothetical protein